MIRQYSCRHDSRTGAACLLSMCLRVRSVRNGFRASCGMHPFLPYRPLGGRFSPLEGLLDFRQWTV